MDHRLIIYSDADLACVDKPSGLLSVPGRGEAGRDCVITRVAAELGWAREAHRLDMDTSGLMIVALNAESHRDLCRQFRDRAVSKQYEAVVLGHPEPDEGEIHLPLRGDIDDRPRQVVDHELGKEASTRFVVIERMSDGTARLGLTPATGRSHQLRVHLASVGHPILGDDLYASAEALAMSERLLLHATALGVVHPRSGERVEFVSACPF
jgi:tRNA pseudouridine32 synthase/23S rRNA pseudouridine746 synthase